MYEFSQIKNELCKQKQEKLKDNLYYYTQINFSYNSNRIEGSHLTEKQTEAIYNTSSNISKKDESEILDDIIETKNHFRLFDYILDNIDVQLTKEMILRMHNILKANTNNYASVGKYKQLPNVIGRVNVITTTTPEKVNKELDNLLEKYKRIDNVLIEDIIDLN